MKKSLILLLVLGFVLGFMSFTAAAETPGRIEISFRVGESILNINGNPIEVETPPYIEEGVTLVPVRVITEAFGAEVEWVSETRQIKLTYQNVNIVLRIDDINVYVNEQQQTLLFQPQLTNNVTMVPLRFITENFGAEVNWDTDTQTITVVKGAALGAAAADIENILQRSNMPMIGDSFLGWSIRRTPGMELYFSQFDGRCTIFVLSENAFIDIDHFTNTEHETFASVRAVEMELARRNTLIGQNMHRTASGVEFVATQYRDRVQFIERRAFLRPDNQIVLISTFIDNSVGAAERDEYLAMVDTFDFVFRAAETEDIADVVNGMRLFDNRDLRIQFRMPAEWWEIVNPDRMNHFLFGRTYDERMFAGLALEIVSLQSGDSAERWARETLASSTRLRNPDSHTHSALRTMQVGGRTATYFQREGILVGAEVISRSIFWEQGGYMYNIYVTVRRDNVAMIQRIVDSVRFESIDPAVVGVMIREPIDDGNMVFTTVRNTGMRFTMDVPATWLRLENNSIFIDGVSGTRIAVTQINETETLELVRGVAEIIAEDPDHTIVREPASVPAGRLSSASHSGFVLEHRTHVEGHAQVYTILYFINAGNRTYLVAFAISERFNSPAMREIAAQVIRSFVVN